MRKLLILSILIVAAAYFIYSDGKNDDEFFNSYFTAMFNAGIEKNTDKFMDNFSFQYHDDYGLNYIVVKNIVKNVFEKYNKINGSFSGLTSSISKDGDGRETAIVNFDAKVTGLIGNISSDLLGLNGTPENITIYLEKSTLGSWQIKKVEGIEHGDY